MASVGKSGSACQREPFEATQGTHSDETRLEIVQSIADGIRVLQTHSAIDLTSEAIDLLLSRIGRP